jgi:voltage-gated potassium channel
MNANQNKTAVTFIFGFVLFFIVAGILTFQHVEGWNFIEAFYYVSATLTTVGYGDISPETPLGQLIASIIMIMGYGIIAVPTGIVTSELNRQSQATSSPKTKACAVCNTSGLPIDAHYCLNCGEKIHFSRNFIKSRILLLSSRSLSIRCCSETEKLGRFL